MKGMLHVQFLKFFLSRLAVFIMVVFIGVTTVFFIPRLMPSNPVEGMVSQLQANSSLMDPAAVAKLREVLTQNFGLNGTLFEQYFGFIKRVVFTQDFGPSLSMYPTPVSKLIGTALPWSLGLLLTTTLLAWLIGNAIGLLAGFRKDKTYSRILEGIAITLYPIPYYIFALVLVIFFAYILPVFPLTTIVVGKGLSLQHIVSIIYNSFLPAISMILIGTGWWVLSMKAITTGIAEEDYVVFARLKGLSERKIMTKYVLRNATLPQVTMLSLQLGTIFSGAIVTEILFSYPGVGTLIYNAILQSDYNLILGTITVSILAVSTATFLIDLLYPFLDPRIRYK